MNTGRLLLARVCLPVYALIATGALSAEIRLPEKLAGGPVDLSRDLRFAPADRPEFARPELNDEDWERVDGFPHNWKDRHDPELRVAWYRVRLRLPAGGYPESLGVHIFNLNDTDEVFWDGVRIAGSGTIDPEREIPRVQAYSKDRVYEIPPGLVRPGASHLLAIRVQQSSYYRSGFANNNSDLSLGAFEDLQRTYYLEAFQETLPAVLILVVGLLFLIFFGYRPNTPENFFFGLSSCFFAAYFLLRSRFAFLMTEDLVVLKRIEYLVLFFLFYLFLDFIYYFFRDNVRNKWLEGTVLGLHAIPVLSSGVVLASDDVRLWYEFLTKVFQPLWVLPLGLMIWILFRGLRAGNRDAKYIAFGFAVGLIAIIHDTASSRFWLPYEARIGTYGFLLFLVMMALTIGARSLRLHQEIDRQRRELARLDELKDRFLSNLSHELNDPIASILLNAEMLKAGDYAGEELPESYDQLYVDGVQLKGLVQKMMIASRLESDEIKPIAEDVELASILEEVREQLRESFPDENWEVESNAESTALRTDPALLRTVLYEIVKNSLQYGPAGGVRVRCEARRDGATLAIRLIDNGSGVREDNLERIKDKFVRVDDSLNYSESGTGLGLYLADRLSTILGGELRIENDPEGGLRAEVRLPA